MYVVFIEKFILCFKKGPVWLILIFLNTGLNVYGYAFVQICCEHTLLELIY